MEVWQQMLILAGAFTLFACGLVGLAIYGFIQIANGCDNCDDETDKELHDL